MRGAMLAMFSLLALLAVATALPYKEVGRYELTADTLTWFNAHQACKEQGGFLAIPQSETEAEELMALMTTAGVGEAHAGFHDSIREDKYITVLDQSLDNQGYYEWAADSTPGPDSNCGSLSTDGLKSIPCDTLLPALCQLPLWKDSYDYIEGHGYYRLSQRPLNWLEAVAECRSEGAYLLLLRHTDEVEALQTRYSDIVGEEYHVQYGAHHMHADHTFVTLFDEKLYDSGYYTWHSGFPGVAGWSPWTNAENPVISLSIARDWANKGLLLTNQTLELPYICKHDLTVRGSSFVIPPIQP